jgi:hypothetical protein
MRDDRLRRWIAGATVGAAALALTAGPAVAQERGIELVTPPGDAAYNVKFRFADPDGERIYYQVGSDADSPAGALPDNGAADEFSATRGSTSWVQAWLSPYCAGAFSVHDPGAECDGRQAGDDLLAAHAGRILFSTATPIPPGMPALPIAPALPPFPNIPKELYIGDASTTALRSRSAPDPAVWGTGSGINGVVATSPDLETVAFTSSDPRTSDAASLPAGQHVYVWRDGTLRLVSAPVGGASGGECADTTCPTWVLPGSADASSSRGARLAHAVSDDGERIFFTSGRKLHPDAIAGRTNAYVLDGGTLRLLSAGLEPSTPNPVAHSRFEWATPDGSRAFVVTNSSPAWPGASNALWAVDVPTGTTTRITRDARRARLGLR